jgi:energy-coupling factor transporter ATP-binding protein EcfA2
MFIPEELVDIIQRIGSSTHTDADLQRLGQIFGVTVAAGERSIAINQDTNGATITTGDTILNIIFQADGLLIGEKVYQGDSAEEVKSLLQKIFQPKVSIDWQKSSRHILNEQIQRLTSNPLTHTEGIAYRTEQVYVPLGLVKPKRQSIRGEDVTPEQGSLLYEETEITQKFEHEEFLEKVLQQGKSIKSGGKRIAIIGEPGAGKTTLLQQIARWVSDNIDKSIVIWVSFADLQGQSLEQYLFERWLPSVLQRQGQAEAFTKEKNDLLAQFQQQRVWLLLDGADEMYVSSNDPLNEIRRQISTGALLQQAQIVLSCRSNLWDGSRNELDSFDTYRTLKFSYPQQVEQFIDNWFSSAPSDKTQTGKTLCMALKEVGKERIQDLVKNPLRLTLLCFNWYLGEGKLPETRAGLYEQFVDDFYQWEKGQFITTGEKQKQLNAALGELAAAAIDQEEIRFRLRQEFICKYLGSPSDIYSLFWLALKLGWLNQVGVEADNPRKRVYAFFHPTFQEYFAAKYFYSRNSSEVLVEHINKENWQEIFTLYIDMIGESNAEKLILKAQSKLNESFSDNLQIQKYLDWTFKKSIFIKEDIRKAAAIRAFYFALNLEFCLALKLDITHENNLNQSRLEAKNIDQILDFTLVELIDNELFKCYEKTNLYMVKKNDLTTQTEYGSNINQRLALDMYIDYNLVLILSRSQSLSLILDSYDTHINIRFVSIARHVKTLLEEIVPTQNGSLLRELQTIYWELLKIYNRISGREFLSHTATINIVNWWSKNGENFIDKFRSILIANRNIGREWQLKDNDWIQLRSYHNASKFLLCHLTAISSVNSENISIFHQEYARLNRNK